MEIAQLEAEPEVLLINAREGLRASRKEQTGEYTCTGCAAISIPWGRGESLTMVLAYRPPAPTVGAADNGNTARLMRTLAGLEGQVVIVGDFQRPWH